MIRPRVRLGLPLPLAALLAAPLAGQTGSRPWRPEERVLIGDMSVVEAVAADENVLYIVTPTGIGIYDLRFDRWQPPVTALDGSAAQGVLPAAS